MTDAGPINSLYSVRAAVPRLGSSVARFIAAFALRNWRCGAGRIYGGGIRPELVAGATARSDWLQQLAIPMLVFFRRQQAAHQPGLADRRRIFASRRFYRDFR
jgi:hypothetical protein